jgi:hypothetical protein
VGERVGVVKGDNARGHLGVGVVDPAHHERRSDR